MQKQDAFSSCHPLVNFLFFLLTLTFSMCFIHPASQLISLFSALACTVRLNGWEVIRKRRPWLLSVMLTAAVVNPAFSHKGETILAYLPSGNPLTLESILYGVSAAMMLGAVMTWFLCCTAVMTTDKLLYLFGRVVPALSLALSMTLRFVPKFGRQLQIVTETQRGLGRDVSAGTVRRRVRVAVSILSILATWSLENAIETADSMKSRGYGLPGRTAFSIYRLDSRDKAVLLWLGFCGFFIFSGWMAGGFYWKYYPAIKTTAVTPMTVMMQLCFLALCLTPVGLDFWAGRFWRERSDEV